METLRLQKNLGKYLIFCGLMLIILVAVGGITRLTSSGLSMVEWKPITGIMPPLNQSEWESLFKDYQKFPEYQIINHNMTLSGFKIIFFWEYLHRMLGRVLGLLLLSAWVFTLIKKT